MKRPTLLLISILTTLNLFANKNPLSNSAPSIAHFLNEDGTLDLYSGYTGELNLLGFNILLDENKGIVVDPEKSNEEEMLLSSWSALGTGLDHQCRSILLDGNGNLFAGGIFTIAGGISANYVAKWDGSNWSSLGTGLNNICYKLVMDANGDLYAGGLFTMAGGILANYIAKWDGSNWSALGTGFNSTCVAIAIDGSGNIYAGGGFTMAGGSSANNIAKWNGSTWSALGSGFGGFGSFCSTLIIDSNGDLLAGGEFSSAGGISANNIAKWNGSTWSTIGTGLNAPCEILALDGNGNLYAGGTFTAAGGNLANRITKWDGSTWSALGTGLNSFCREIVIDGNNNLYVGGGFSEAGGISAIGVAKWDGSTWSALGSGLNGGSSGIALTLDNNGNLYIGGSFTTAGGISANRIAKYHCAFTNYSIDFDGSNDRISAPAVSANFWSIEAWINPDALSGYQSIYVDDSNSGFFLKGSNINFFRSGDQLTGSTALSTSTWNHIAITYDGVTLRAYLNGSLDASAAYAGGTFSTGSVYMGANSNVSPGEQFNGKMDELRFWRGTLTASDISNIYNKTFSSPGSSSACLKTYYQMSNGSGTSLTDNSGNGNTGTIENGAIWTTDVATLTSTTSPTCSSLGLCNEDSDCDDGNACTTDVCTLGQCTNTTISCDDGNPCTDDICDPVSGCISTNNTSACDDGSVCTTGDQCSGGTCTGTLVSCNDSNPCTYDSCDPFSGCFFQTVSGCTFSIDLDGSDDRISASAVVLSTWTIEAWLFPDALSGYQSIYIDAVNSGFFLKGNKINFWRTSDHLIGSSSLSTGTWNHVAITYDGATLAAYLNGNPDGTASYSGGSFPGGMVYIGANSNPSPGEQFNGRIDELRVWSGALSASDIGNIYNQTFFDPSTSNTCLEIYYQMSNGVGTSLTDNSGNGKTGTLENGASWISSNSSVTAALVPTCASLNLPIDLIDFRAKIEKEEVELTWRTDSETNNEGFYIQHSTDVENWEDLEFIFGSGNSTVPITYDYLHKNPNLGINYYRLKQIDFDASFEYSKVVSVDLQQEEKIHLFPNPTTGMLEIEGAEGSEIRILDTTGRLMFYQVLLGTELNISNFPNGLYFIILTKDGKQLEGKVLKK